MDIQNQHSGPAVPAQPAPAERRPDPGSKTGALLAVIFSCIFICGVLFLQQRGVQKLSEAKPDLAASNEATAFTIIAKGFTKGFGSAFSSVADKDRATLFDSIVKNVEDAAQTPDEKLRAAIVGGELAGAEKAVSQLETAETWVQTQIKDNKANSKNGLEIDEKVLASFEENRSLLLRHYQSKVSEEKGDGVAPVGLSDSELQKVKDHFDWFGRLAAVYGDKSAADRPALYANSDWVILMMVLFVCMILCALFAGIVLFIIALVKLANGSIQRKFVPPLPGGSVYLETVAMFALSFLALQFLLFLLTKALFHKGDIPPPWFMQLHLALQWLLVLVPLFPLLRGVSFQRWRDDIGFVAPKGIAREMGAGVLAYLAGLPVFVGGAIVSIILKFLIELLKGGGGEGRPPVNPVFEEVLGNDPISLILFFSLATIWAPFVEETIFRGALFRHLRSRVGLLVAAAISALAFGVMHGYEFVMLGGVISLGFVFALMREWRKSLIPSITAHMLHNGTLLIFVAVIIRLINS